MENNYYNTILLLRGSRDMTSLEYKKFSKGDTICGFEAYPEELEKWEYSEENKKLALKELENYRCEYAKTHGYNCYSVEEYALEYCNYDEDGFVDGSDFDFAEEVEIDYTIDEE